MHVIRNNTISLLRLFILGIKSNDLRQIHCICRAVNDVCAVIRENGSGLVGHGMNNTQQSGRERNTCQALCAVHVIARCHILIVRIYQISLDHLDGADCRSIGEIAVYRGHICFNRVGQSIHTGMRYKFLRHSFCQLRINDGYVRCNLEISDGIFDTVRIVCND